MASTEPSRLLHWREIRVQTEKTLSDIHSEEIYFLKWTARAKAYCLQSVNSLQIEVANTSFSSKTEEIGYYKEIRPFFLSHILFFTRVHDLELSIPPGPVVGQILYYEAELSRIRDYWADNLFIYRYLKEGKEHLDDRLFFHDPESPNLVLPEALFPISQSPKCYDWVISKLAAGERLQEHISAKITALNKPHSGTSLNTPYLSWTESKTGLIELAYAMQSAGVFNNGKVDLKEIIEYFQDIFHVQLGNYPRTFQEILSRKKGYTNCLDRLRDKLLLRIQEIEEKYLR